ncbi:hypothetical protein GCM10025880_50580 [Methylorubrum aminovorans]|nr:hypothetical protein GCM10025880_50580 [Methylorubrum aminovorans]
MLPSLKLTRFARGPGTAPRIPAVTSRTPASRAASRSTLTIGSASTMWAKGSPALSFSVPSPKVRKTGRTGSPTRLSLMTSRRIGSAAGSMRGHRSSCSNIRRGPAATA